MRYLYWLEKLIGASDNARMHVESESLLSLLSRHPSSLVRKNFIIVVSAIIVFVIITVSYSLFFVKDVILHDNQLNINSYGVFNPHKALDCEYGIFLFNASDLWANSGIQVFDGDRIRINISGSVQTSVVDVIDDAKNNKEIKYRWVKYSKDTIPSPPPYLKCCLYREDTTVVQFGSVLMGVFPECNDYPSHPVVEKNSGMADLVYVWKPEWGKKFQKIKKEKLHKVKKNGVLHFSVNDIYADSLYQIQYKADSNGKMDSVKLAKTLALMKEHPDFYYKDNLGQLLVSIEVMRHIPGWWFNPSLIYRRFEYDVNEAISVNSDKWLHRHVLNPVKVCWKTLKFLGHITLLFSVWMLVIASLILLLFYLGGLVQKASVGFKRIIKKVWKRFVVFIKKVYSFCCRRVCALKPRRNP